MDGVDTVVESQYLKIVEGELCNLLKGADSRVVEFVFCDDCVIFGDAAGNGDQSVDGANLEVGQSCL